MSEGSKSFGLAGRELSHILHRVRHPVTCIQSLTIHGMWNTSLILGFLSSQEAQDLLPEFCLWQGLVRCISLILSLRCDWQSFMCEVWG